MSKSTVILVGFLSENCVALLQDGLIHAASKAVIGASRCQPEKVCLCQGIRSSTETKELQLQVLMRPGLFSVRPFMQGTLKLKPAMNKLQNADMQQIGTLMTYLVRFIASSTDMSSTCIMVHVVSHTFQWDDEIKKALQFAADKRIQINFCAIPENAEEGARQTLADFASSILDADNATLTCCSDDIAGVEEVCMSFLRNIIAPPGQSVRLAFSVAAGHRQFIDCSASCDVLPADKPMAASKCCPCHGLPVTTAGSPDARMCAVTRALLRMEDCPLDPRFVQIAPGSILHIAQNSKVSIVPPPGWDGTLTVSKRVKVDDVSETILLGCCHVLTASNDAFSNHAGGMGDEELLTALCQELRDRDEALIAHANYDLSSASATLCPMFYVLFPASNTSALLARRFACREEIFSIASEQPEAVASTASAQAAVCSLLGSIPCPVFSPLDYSNGFVKLLQALIADSIPMPAMDMSAPRKKTPGSQGHQTANVSIGGHKNSAVVRHADNRPRQSALSSGRVTEHMCTDNDSQAAGGSCARPRPEIRLPTPPNQLQDQVRDAVRKAAAKKAQKPTGPALNLKRTQRH
ncbi:hypothetical protein COCOBI_02-2850 [Coccomyxa sp. Obi]|nr:hypothetical protein COCOBI_02-2850 [Coccomyxa sp. Obi]